MFLLNEELSGSSLRSLRMRGRAACDCSFESGLSSNNAGLNCIDSLSSLRRDRSRVNNFLYAYFASRMRPRIIYEFHYTELSVLRCRSSNTSERTRNERNGNRINNRMRATVLMKIDSVKGSIASPLERKTVFPRAFLTRYSARPRNEVWVPVTSFGRPTKIDARRRSTGCRL